MSMRQHVTVVPSDRLIIVDGVPLRFDFPAPATLHALQWHDDNGHMEWTDDYNMALDASLYAEEVAPWVALWEAEQARREQEAAEDEAARIAEYNSESARFARLRAERDRRIGATDYLMATDYPLKDEQRVDITTYRQALRDLPAQKGAPWDGGGENTPWPALPAVTAAK